jgi:hypothetical protein
MFVGIVTEAELEELAPASLESLQDSEVPIFSFFFFSVYLQMVYQVSHRAVA